MVHVIRQMDLRFPMVGSDEMKTLADTEEELLAE